MQPANSLRLSVALGVALALTGCSLFGDSEGSCIYELNGTEVCSYRKSESLCTDHLGEFEAGNAEEAMDRCEAAGFTEPHSADTLARP
jgi:hypothetical protein